LWASKNTFCHGKIQKSFFILFFTPKPCYIREELAGSALANERGRPAHMPVLAKHCLGAPRSPWGASKMKWEEMGKISGRHSFEMMFYNNNNNNNYNAGIFQLIAPVNTGGV
jgi:hypothetical protein